jgi:hypothetical protein
MNNQDPAFQPTQDANSSEEQFSDGNQESPVQREWREMREEKMNNEQDVSLGSPQDANTGKHVNFRDIEDAGSTPDQSSDTDEETPVQREWREMREEKMNNDQDISLGSPQDANTGKHINFPDVEDAGSTPDQSGGKG